MRPIQQEISATGSTDWTFLDWKAKEFNVSVAVKFATGTVLTYKVEHTFNDPHLRQPATISQATTVATVTLNDHGLVIGDSIIISNDNVGNTNLSGTRAVLTTPDANTFTYLAGNSATVAAFETPIVVLNVFNHVTLAGTASDDGNYVNPIRATRLTVSSHTSGTARFFILNP